MKIVLASGSPRRIEVMDELANKHGFEYQVLPNDFDEGLLKKSLHDPEELVRQLSLGKAEASFEKVADQDDDLLVIGGDTIVVFEDQILGKPETSENAAAMLRSLSGKSNKTVTGLTILVRKNGVTKQIQRVGTTFVKMKNLTDQQIADYVASGEPLDKAGAYAIQGKGRALIAEVTGNLRSYIGIDPAAVGEILLEILN
ncbi:MAG: Maf family protein [Candidatus Nomurabacteria bacterium]|jgi:septum formation protein|nr:Maf family protein [Candidatus Nomurabacteria bacterium]